MAVVGDEEFTGVYNTNRNMPDFVHNLIVKQAAQSRTIQTISSLLILLLHTGDIPDSQVIVNMNLELMEAIFFGKSVRA